MAENLKNYRVTVPTEYVGHAIGHLSAIGGWLDGHLHEPEANRSVVSVRLPGNVDPADVKNVLAKIVQGEVLIVGNDASNDEDA